MKRFPSLFRHRYYRGTLNADFNGIECRNNETRVQELTSHSREFSTECLKVQQIQISYRFSWISNNKSLESNSVLSNAKTGLTHEFFESRRTRNFLKIVSEKYDGSISIRRLDLTGSINSLILAEFLRERCSVSIYIQNTIYKKRRKICL